MPQIDILLKSAADTGGFDKTSAKAKELQGIFDRWGNSVFVPITGGLQDIQRQSRETGNEWDRLKRKLEQKFGGADFLKDLLRLGGLGSGFAVVETIVGKVRDHFREIAESERKIVDATQRLAELSTDVRRSKMTPEALVAEDENRLAEVNARIKQLEEIEGRRRVVHRDPQYNAASRMWTPAHDEVIIDSRTVKESEELAKQIELRTKLDAQLEKNRALVEKGTVANALQEQFGGLDAQAASIAAAREEDLTTARDAATEAEERGRVAAEELDQELTQRARIYREMADPFKTYRDQLEEISMLERLEKMNAADAAAARARVKFEMDGGFTPAIDAGREAMHAFNNELAKLSGRNDLTDSQKRSQRIELLKQENSEIERQVAALRALIAANPGKDTKQLTKEVETLLNKRDSNNVDIANAPQSRIGAARLGAADLSDPSKHLQAGQGVEGGLLGALVKFGTVADQIAAGIENTIGAAVSGVTEGIMGWINGTMTFGQALRNIGSSILQTMLQTLVQMGVQWAINSIVAKGALFGIEATADTLRAARVVKENAAEAATLPAKTAGAAAAGISSFGGALAFGLLAVALIASLAGGFADGGYTGAGGRMQPAGIVHAGEWVAPQWMVNDPVYGGMIANLDAMRSGGVTSLTRPTARGDGPSAPLGGGASQTVQKHYFLFDRAEFARMMQEDSEGWFHDMAHSFVRQNA